MYLIILAINYNIISFFFIYNSLILIFIIYIFYIYNIYKIILKLL